MTGLDVARNMTGAKRFIRQCEIGMDGLPMCEEVLVAAFGQLFKKKQNADIRLRIGRGII